MICNDRKSCGFSIAQIIHKTVSSNLEEHKTNILPILEFISQTLLAFSAIIATILIYRFQLNKSKKERTLDFSQRHQDLNFYIQVLSPVWKMYLKWKYLPEEEREEYKRAVAMGWIGFESQKPKHILKNWIPDFKVSSNYKNEHYLKKLNISSQTEHESLTMYVEFWTDFYIAVEQNLIQKKLCFVLARQYKYHQQFFFELREYIKNLKSTEFQNDELPLWIGYTEKLEVFFNKIESRYK